MNALVRAELLKLRTTRMLAWLLLATVAMVVVTLAVSVPSASNPGEGSVFTGSSDISSATQNSSVFKVAKDWRYLRYQV